MKRSLRFLLLIILAAMLAVNSVAYAEPDSEKDGNDTSNSGDSEDQTNCEQTYRWDPYSRFFRFFDIPVDFIVQLNLSSPTQAGAQLNPGLEPEQTPQPEIFPILSGEEIAAASQVLSGQVIGLDPGHQRFADYALEEIAPGSDLTKVRQSEGCYGVRSDVPEYRINLLVAEKVRMLLESCGATVVMTRTDSDVDLSNIDRALMMNDSGACLWVRVHCNASDDEQQEGACVLIPSETVTPDIYEYSLYLGQCVSAAFTDATGAPNMRLVVLENQTGFNWSRIPVITVEMGYLSNAKDDVQLNSDSYQMRCALGIFNGIIKYFIKTAGPSADVPEETASASPAVENTAEPTGMPEPAETLGRNEGGGE